MNEPRLNVYIIETPNSNRANPLKATLADHPRVAVHMVEATMLSTQLELEVSGIKVERNFFWALTSRYLTFPEIGCANSHNLARLECSQLESGGVILEDDARIVDKDYFVNSSLGFLEEFKETSSILSLTHSPRTKNTKRSTNGSQLIKLFGSSPLAVAYAITPLAAKRLLISNDPVKYVSDWPEIEVRNFCLREPAIVHGDSNTISTIDPAGDLGRENKNLLNTLRKVTFLDYFIRARGFVEFNVYFKYNLLKPIRFHLDSLRFLMIRNLHLK